MWQKAPDTCNLVERIVLDTNVELGIYPVLYGMRVRAGLIGDAGCPIDWCCGGSQAVLEWAYAAAKALLLRHRSFAGIPSHSEIKPLINDVQFIAKIGQLLEEPLVPEPLPPIYELRQRYFSENPLSGLAEELMAK